ncbi:hypothetical protein ACFYWO_23020 [Streptomyces sp. NPDC002932]|uniref:hypothetical protein n=1 Tax=Streptomyces sp. NPDC002932 TaxID=3364672 RepID=UPI0036744B21
MAVVSTLALFGRTGQAGQAAALQVHVRPAPPGHRGVLRSGPDSAASAKSTAST